MKLTEKIKGNKDRTTEKITRLDIQGELREMILPLCRLQKGEIWEDTVNGHRVGVLDASKSADIKKLMSDERVGLALNDPPYNLAVGNENTRNLSKIDIEGYLRFSEKWISNVVSNLNTNAHFYLWIGADYKDNFQPLPDLMLLLRKIAELTPRNMLTMRNQRGYGTQKNWMWVRQELLYYTKGRPEFNIEAVYTDIPKILKGYYKKVNGELKDNLERGKSDKIRAGNVWVDIQQVFYRMEENVPGCYAQKPLKAIARIIESSSSEEDIVLDLFSHSGTTLIAGERLNRRVFTADSDPVFAEITIRRIERLREEGKTGWQWNNPFPELDEKLIRDEVV